jgi:hypothetical protein
MQFSPLWAAACNGLLRLLLVSLLMCCCASPCLSVRLLDGGEVTVDWQQTVFVSRTRTTLQMVMNPLVTRAASIHHNVYSNLAALNSHFTRFQAWFPYVSSRAAQ